MKKLGLIVIISVSLFLSGCGVDPVTGKSTLNFYSDADEIKLGDESHKQIIAQYGEYPDPALQKYVQGIVNRLADVSHRPNLTYPVTILDTPEINAFALPGGHVYVCRGILPYFNSESELAGVMGHEIGHVCAKHGLRRMSQSTGFNIALLFGAYLLRDDNQKANLFYTIGSGVSSLAQLSYSREDEMEADRLGISYEYKAGFSPLGVGRVMTMFERMSSSNNSLQSILSTHPASEIRAKQARIEVRELQQTGTINTDLNRNGYLAQINKVLVGRNPARGVIHENIFYHTGVMLKIAIPNNYTPKLEQPSACLELKNTDGSSIIYLNVNADPKATEEISDAMEKQLNTSPTSAKNYTETKLSGVIHFYLVADNSGVIQISHFVGKYNNQIIEITALQRSSENHVDSSALDTFLSKLTPLSKEDLAKLQPKYLEIYTTQKNDTWESLTNKYFSGKDAKLLAWYNDCELTDPLPEKIKLGLF